jgi:hypothetical protein
MVDSRRLAAVTLLTPVPNFAKPFFANRSYFSSGGAQAGRWAVEPTVVWGRLLMWLVRFFVVCGRKSKAPDSAQRINERQSLWNLFARASL